MDKRNYTYRFKTLDEFQKKFGESWRRVPMGFIDIMDGLLGVNIPNEIDDYGENRYDRIDMMFNGVIDSVGFKGFSISKEMLTKVSTMPDYKPKKFIR